MLNKPQGPAKSDHSEDSLKREAHFFDEERADWLHFLELDLSAFDRWLIRQILRTWDRQVAFIDPEMIRGKVVFEAACGNPRMLSYFRQMGAKKVVGCDISRVPVTRGLSREQTYVHTASVKTVADEIQILFGDVCGPVAEGVQADTMVCFQSLHHLDLPKFSAACSRILKPGGHLIISDPNGGHFLRAAVDYVGKLSSQLSPDESAFTSQEIMDQFVGDDFELVQFKSMNPTLELYFHLSDLLFFSRSPRLAFYAKFPMAVLRFIESFLEQTLLRLIPGLGWRHLYVFKRK